MATYIEFTSKRISRSSSVVLSIIYFEEDGRQIIYCPELDLSGYGEDESEAFSSFEIALEEYLDYTKRKGTLETDLKRLGWHVRPESASQKYIPPEISHLLSKNKDLKNIFEKFDFRKRNIKLSFPAA